MVSSLFVLLLVFGRRPHFCTYAPSAVNVFSLDEKREQLLSGKSVFTPNETTTNEPREYGSYEPKSDALREILRAFRRRYSNEQAFVFVSFCPDTSGHNAITLSAVEEKTNAAYRAQKNVHRSFDRGHNFRTYPVNRGSRKRHAGTFKIPRRKNDLAPSQSPVSRGSSCARPACIFRFQNTESTFLVRFPPQFSTVDTVSGRFVIVLPSARR